ncbi:hypothetical protein BP5796_12894 [Coleophoma crateriformis]|uniref:RBR-type E3 ubiquitin transferase n=1 Tax=Coleophoma crateriformis TaxID=565419 RepID=A0A3D8Q562_9HELO|nr:hypothetical protein BP5796_12894 [Coleophoma crateriformis]
MPHSLLTPVREDERSAELSIISAIFEELVVDDEEPFSAFISLPVAPSTPLAVSFHSASAYSGAGLAIEAIQHLSNLPPLGLHITLPKGYPSKLPPVFKLSTTPQWLPTHTLKQMEAVGRQLWENLGHEQVVYAYIDYLQQEVENSFGVLDKTVALQIPEEHKVVLLDFDMHAKRAAFEKETFNCSICLDPKKGSACYRMLRCGHVFCKPCLQSFYTTAIMEGNIRSVRCLSPGCAKEQDDTEAGKSKKMADITPDELRQIPLESEMIQRYLTLKRKAELESDKNTVYCPRKWCPGGALPKEHRAPAIGDGTAMRQDLMRICEDCSFAFCSRCLRGWHGEYMVCTAETATLEISEDEKASLEYIKLHTKPCPSCDTPAQKSHGCCHMICRTCGAHYCYLCSAWLEPSNPYRHFNIENQGCYQRLWELEGGDGDDGDDGGDIDDVDDMDLMDALDATNEARA